MSQTNSRLQGGGLILPQGSSPGNIGVGEKALILDSDGTVKTQDSAGTKTAISGGDAGLISAPVGAPTADLTVSGLLGDTDGGYVIKGRILTTASAASLVLYINGAPPPAGVGSGGTYTNGTAVFKLGLLAELHIGGNDTAEVANLTFLITMGSKQGIMQPYTCETLSRRASGTVFAAQSLKGQFTMAAEITSVGVHCASAIIDVGSYVSVQRQGFTA